MKSKMNYLICAVPFSENLGDAAINACLKEIITLNGISCDSLDISGRLMVPTQSRNNFRHFIALPSYLRKIAVVTRALIQHARSYRTHSAQINKADAIIIGGGQLFLDFELNFPLKLYLLSRIVKKHKKPTAIISVGASEKFSFIGKKLVNSALKNFAPRLITARDTQSQVNFNNNFYSNKKVHLSPDPAIFISSLFPRDNRIKANDVSICITDPAGLGQNKRRAIETIDFFVNLTDTLLKNGHSVNLFTNGAPEDECIKELVRRRVASSVSSSPRPQNIHDLINIIALSKFIVAHRLHANIIAHSYSVPSIGLGWDSKVESFFGVSNRQDFFYKKYCDAIQEISEKIIAFIADEKNQTYTSSYSPCINKLTSTVIFVKNTDTEHEHFTET